MKLKPGQALASCTDTTTVLVIKAAANDVSLTCGGVEMADPKSAGDKQPVQGDAGEGTKLGKRYVDDAQTVEVLCTKGGAASLALNGAPLSVKAAKSLPASD